MDENIEPEKPIEDCFDGLREWKESLEDLESAVDNLQEEVNSDDNSEVEMKTLGRRVRSAYYRERSNEENYLGSIQQAIQIVEDADIDERYNWADLERDRFCRFKEEYEGIDPEDPDSKVFGFFKELHRELNEHGEEIYQRMAAIDQSNEYDGPDVDKEDLAQPDHVGRGFQ